MNISKLLLTKASKVSKMSVYCDLSVVSWSAIQAAQLASNNNNSTRKEIDLHEEREKSLQILHLQNRLPLLYQLSYKVGL